MTILCNRGLAHAYDHMNKHKLERARWRLANRRARLERLLAIDAPDIIVDKEREMIADSVREIEASAPAGDWALGKARAQP